jgi:predicted transcriptional regulator
MTTTTTLKLPEKLKTRIARLAKETGRSAHSLMIEALEREVAREERMREFVREALVSDAAVEEGAAVYRAEDVHPWLERLAKKTVEPPGPSRGANSLFGERAREF